LHADCIEREQIYFIKVTGGLDIDADNDGVLDAIPTPYRSSIHAIIVGERMFEQDWKVTQVTDAVYRILRLVFQSGLSTDEFIAQMNRFAKILFRDDISGDDRIDHNDIFAWNPREHGDFINMEGIEDAYIDDLTTLPVAQVESQSGDFVGHVDTGLEASFMAINGDYAYVSTPTAIHCIDISQPAAAVITSSRFTSSMAYDLVINGHWLYALTQSGILVFDITRPEEMLLSSSSPFLYLYGVRASANGVTWGAAQTSLGARLFPIGDNDSALFETFSDLSADDYAQHIIGGKKFDGEINLPTSTLGSAIIFEISGDTAIVGYTGFTGSMIHVVDVSDDPTLLSEIPIAGSLWIPLDAQFANNHLYLSMAYGDLGTSTYRPELLVFDLSDPYRPAKISVPNAPVRNFQLLDNTIYSWDSNDRLSARNAYTYELQNSVVLPHFAEQSLQSFHASINLAFSFSDGESYFEDLHREGLVEKFSLDYRASRRMQVDDNFAYFAAGKYGFLIYPLP